MVTVSVLGAAAELLEGSEKLVAVASLAADLGTSGDPPRDGLHELSLGGDVIAETGCRHTFRQTPKEKQVALEMAGERRPAGVVALQGFGEAAVVVR